MLNFASCPRLHNMPHSFPAVPCSGCLNSPQLSAWSRVVHCEVSPGGITAQPLQPLDFDFLHPDLHHVRFLLVPQVGGKRTAKLELGRHELLQLGSGPSEASLHYWRAG